MTRQHMRIHCCSEINHFPYKNIQSVTFTASETCYPAYDEPQNLPNASNGDRMTKRAAHIVPTAILLSCTTEKEHHVAGVRISIAEGDWEELLGTTTGQKCQRLSRKMRVKRLKTARKYLGFYKNSFGIFEPYQVLG